MRVDGISRKAGFLLRSGMAVEVDGAAGGAVVRRAGGAPADGAVRGRGSPRDRQAGGDGRPSGARVPGGGRSCARCCTGSAHSSASGIRRVRASCTGSTRTRRASCSWHGRRRRSRRSRASSTTAPSASATSRSSTGACARARGTIDQPIGRHPRERQRMSVRARRGRAAVTDWEVVERLPGATVLALTPRHGPNAPAARASRGPRPSDRRRPGLRHADRAAAMWLRRRPPFRARRCTPRRSASRSRRPVTSSPSARRFPRT